ncbi:hypothetical protein BWD42_03995 [Sphingobacterium sp. CZ-UAM]|uniref:hypothetical protein n=1 Tax=Sphingobacterium sp. CZ-UAM TaxID=1933868 RepID=UPI000985CBD4|nr:hypothetical protein [Sphingobacterium sp. CZ-UAM]OOG19119.1 hypothetical protein BWD42_03995 [Sphingobacterium sp. CZ-UAM]
METLEIFYQGRMLYLPYEVEDQSQIEKITKEYYVYGKKGERYTFKQHFKWWELCEGKLAEDLSNTIIDSFILRYEKNLLGLCYYHGQRQIVSIYNMEYVAQEYAYSLLVNNIDLGHLTYSKYHGWKHDLRVNLTAQWFGSPEVDIIIEMIENGEIPWLKKIKK